MTLIGEKGESIPLSAQLLTAEIATVRFNRRFLPPSTPIHLNHGDGGGGLFLAFPCPCVGRPAFTFGAGCKICFLWVLRFLHAVLVRRSGPIDNIPLLHQLAPQLCPGDAPDHARDHS